MKARRGGPSGLRNALMAEVVLADGILPARGVKVPRGPRATEISKHCHGCDRDLALNAVYAQRDSKFGRESRCPACKAAAQRRRRSGKA